MVVAACATLGFSVQAQEIQIDAVRALADDAHIDWVSGGRVTFATSSGGGAIRLGGQWLSGVHDRTTAVCAQPADGNCDPELAMDDGRIVGGFVGINFPAFHRGRFSIGFVPSFHVAHVRATTVGLTSGRRLVADKVMYGPFVDLALRFVPVRIAGISIIAASGAGVLLGSDAHIAQAYAPFDGAFVMKQGQLGVAFSY